MSIKGEVETTLQSLHKWQIPRVCLSCRQLTSRIFSPWFTVHGAKWNIMFYPKSNEKDTNWGLKRFIKNSDLIDKKDLILKDSNLTVLCKICTISPKIKNYKLDESDDEEDTFDFINYEKYFLNEMLSDVQFRVDEEIIPAHKFVLATRSEVFAAMFTHNMKENEENKVEIRDFNCQAFKKVLRYIYTGKVDEIETIIDNLLLIANKYMLQRLTKICENNLIKKLSNENVLDYLMLASKYNLSRLKKESIMFIASNSRELVTT